MTLPSHDRARAATREEKLREHRAINQRPKPCPHCHMLVQAGNLARHQRRHAREYGWA